MPDSDEYPSYYAQCGLNPLVDSSTALTLKVSRHMLAGGPFDTMDGAAAFLDAHHAHCPKTPHIILELFGYLAQDLTTVHEYTPKVPPTHLPNSAPSARTTWKATSSTKET